MDYYEILEVPRDADQKTIKKAYFKLVRQYSPEKDPQRFQQIREAYENLTAGGGREGKEGLKLEFPSDLLASWMREEMQTLMKLNDYKTAMKIAQKGIDQYGDIEGFLCFLAICQMRAGNTGKAAKNFELLTKRFPQKNVYKKLLAIAYYERGYGKKAYEAFVTGHEEGTLARFMVRDVQLCILEKWPGQRPAGMPHALAGVERNIRIAAAENGERLPIL